MFPFSANLFRDFLKSRECLRCTPYLFCLVNRLSGRARYWLRGFLAQRLAQKDGKPEESRFDNVELTLREARWQRMFLPMLSATLLHTGSQFTKPECAKDYCPNVDAILGVLVNRFDQNECISHDSVSFLGQILFPAKCEILKRLAVW